MDSDWHNASMLMTCYHGRDDEQNLQRVARMTLDRAQAALARDPTNGTAIAVGASALARLGEVERAKEWIQRGLFLDPNNLSMRYNLACALIMELHDYDAALEVLEQFFDEVKSPIHVKHIGADPDMDPIREDLTVQGHAGVGQAAAWVGESHRAAKRAASHGDLESGSSAQRCGVRQRRG